VSDGELTPELFAELTGFLTTIGEVLVRDLDAILALDDLNEAREHLTRLRMTADTWRSLVQARAIPDTVDEMFGGE
jgi:hypothetical protein